MKKAIYKYENKINHKIYIGQTNKPQRRFQEHLIGHSYYTSLIERAIKKYGIDNFEFTILEWTENYDDREKYWIEYYSCYKPYGYNICEGGGYLPNVQKESHPQCSISEEKARAIQKDLMELELTMSSIVKKYKTTFCVVNNINTGHTWNCYNLSYPLRKERDINNKKAEKVIHLLKNTTLSYKEIGKEVGWKESQIGMVNRGENHKQENEVYPLRANPQNYSDKVDECIKLLKENEKTNAEIAFLLNTSSCWVSKVNNGKTHRKENIVYPIRK